MWHVYEVRSTSKLPSSCALNNAHESRQSLHASTCVIFYRCNEIVISRCAYIVIYDLRKQRKFNQFTICTLPYSSRCTIRCDCLPVSPHKFFFLRFPRNEQCAPVHRDVRSVSLLCLRELADGVAYTKGGCMVQKGFYTHIHRARSLVGEMQPYKSVSVDLLKDESERVNEWTNERAQCNAHTIIKIHEFIALFTH